MRKVIILIAAVMLAVTFTFPAILFAEEGDANSTVGVREQDNQAGQYILGDKDTGTTQPNDTINDNSTAEVNNGSIDGATGDGDTEVFCIDGDTTWDTGNDKYTLTDIDVSDELLGESAPLDDDDKDGVYFKNDAVLQVLWMIFRKMELSIQSRLKRSRSYLKKPQELHPLRTRNRYGWKRETRSTIRGMQPIRLLSQKQPKDWQLSSCSFQLIMMLTRTMT